MVSEKYTMKGYKFKEFLRGNKEGIKLLITAVAAYATYAVDLIQDPVLKASTVTVVAAVVKFGLDAFDYFLKE